ncbi:unnamed protein product [Prunus armeniaca]|uniref:Uncharacterized protein n=1 Tax=Prunus armeniaca TaxID=36596 RepID=A0A6J5WYP7_PRUAR|nr:unnamed protein product [Prunus armeniaca]
MVRRWEFLRVRDGLASGRWVAYIIEALNLLKLKEQRSFREWGRRREKKGGGGSREKGALKGKIKRDQCQAFRGTDPWPTISNIDIVPNLITCLAGVEFPFIQNKGERDKDRELEREKSKLQVYDSKIAVLDFVACLYNKNLYEITTNTSFVLKILDEELVWMTIAKRNGILEGRRKEKEEKRKERKKKKKKSKGPGKEEERRKKKKGA